MKKSLLYLVFFVYCTSSFTELFSQAGDCYTIVGTEVWYIRRTPPEPWTWAPILNDNITEMDAVFGAGLWNSDYFTSVDPAIAFGPTSKFVFLEGGDDHAIPLADFLATNISIIQDWVYAGGHLFLNAAPNYGSDIDFGFNGTTLVYPDFTVTGYAVVPLHPIFNGPYIPTGLAWDGNYFGHATVDVPCGFTLIDNGAGSALASEMYYGSGIVIFGGMTVSSWHTPSPEASNMRKNILNYLGNTLTPFFVSTYFSYSDTIYCQFEDNQFPIFAVGADTGIFAVTPTGLVMDTITGEIDLGASTPGTYTITNTVTVTGCSFLSCFDLTVSGTPVANAGPDQFVCLGNSVALDGSGGITYLWTPPVYLDDATLEDPTVMNPPTNMFYQLIAYNTDGCPDTDEVIVTLFPQPIIDAGEDQIMVLGGFTNLDASGASTYTWSPIEDLSDPNISNPVAYPEDTTEYMVIGIDVNGCIDTDYVTIFVIEESDIATPTAFTPNEDGVNDIYKPSFVGLGEITDFSVYSRWGSLLYFTADPTIGWDGTYIGLDQEVGTYMIVIKATNQFGDVIIKTSTLALLR